MLLPLGFTKALAHRQIRNAFQTAIALVEDEAHRPGAELPCLGKKQFEIVAQASEEFDKYLKKTLGAVDADLARREETRYDRFASPAASQTQPPITKKMQYRSRRNAKDPESEAEEESESESEDESEDE